MEKMLYDHNMFYEDVEQLAERIDFSKYGSIYGVPQGGVPFALLLSKMTGLPIISEPEIDTIIVDDIIDSGDTRMRYPTHDFMALISKLPVLDQASGIPMGVKTWFARQSDQWVVFWWENTAEGSIKDSVKRILQFIGEDAEREGLKDTPARVVKSWNKLYEGYGKKVEDIITVFEDGACDEMVLLSDIEFYSTCEHHMIPFFGKAHIAYIPNGKVIGVSKLARILEVFTRRLQIQERIGQQVVAALNEHLDPLGAACIIEAQHLCMVARGVEKQNSVMKTSELTGVFKEKPEARAELFQLIRG